MKTDKCGQYLSLIMVGYRRLEVADSYQLPKKGILRVLIVLQALFQDLLPADYSFGVPGTSKLTWGDLAEQPARNLDPVAATICSLVADERRIQNFPNDAIAQKMLLIDPGFLKQRNIELIKAVVQYTSRLALALGYDGTRKIRKSAELNRFRMYRFCLQATSCSSCTPHPLMLMESARKNVESMYRGGTGGQAGRPIFNSNWLDPHVRRKRPWTFGQFLINLGNLPAKDVRSIRARARQEDAISDPEDVDDYKEWGATDLEELSEFYGRNRYLGALKIASAMTPGVCPAPRELPEFAVIQIVEKSLADDSPGATYVAFMCAALAGTEALHDLIFHRRSGLISTKICRPQKKAPKCRSLFRPSEKRFFRYVPPGLADRFKRYRRRFGIRRMNEFATEWLSQQLPKLQPTLRKLERALMAHGSSWFGFDWIYAYYGIEGHKRNGHAAKSYCLIDSASRRSLVDYLRSFFGFEAPAAEEDLPAVGSRFVLRDEVVRCLMRRLAVLWSEAHHLDLDRVLAQLTTIAALTHVAFLILTGLRNYPMDPPLERYLNPTSDWELIHQKKACVMLYIPQIAREVLRRSWRRYRMCLEQIRSIGYSLDPKLKRFAYGFVELDSVERVAMYTNPCHARIVDGLIADEALTKYANIPRTSFRHWINTKLRESGQYSEIDVRAYVWHSDQVLHPLTRTRFERVVNRDIRDQIARRLAAEAGIPL